MSIDRKVSRHFCRVAVAKAHEAIRVPGAACICVRADYGGSHQKLAEASTVNNQMVDILSAFKREQACELINGLSVALRETK